VNLYQINWKYRDELRPRFGLLRSREFLMKDAYSFDTDIEGLKASYKLMYDAYHRVFERCGLSFRPVEAQAGEIGGDVNHEFMAVAAVGEDDFVWCRNCDYAANVEAAVRGAPTAAETAGGDVASMTPVHTPDLPGIKGVAEFLGVEPSQMLKSIAFDVDGEMGLALVPGDREVNPFALNQALAGRKVRLWEDADFDASPDVPRGYIGPHFPGATVRVADPAVRVGAADGWVTGANQVDHHVRHAALGRDFDVDTYADLVTVVTGDPCPRCGSPLSVDRGIEVGHTFQLGTKYSVALGAEYTDETGQQHPMVMGCYGIGVSRVVAAAVEEHHDASGLMWPAALAPYQVHLVSLPGKGEAAPEVRAAADRLYDELRAAGVDVLYDDRDQSPGVKFADADLLGVPTQLILGAKGLARGVVERKDRRSGERDEVALDAAAGVVSGG
jgi:prolyl-tRNA synthetase